MHSGERPRREARARVLETLAVAPCLLVVDNCEHVVDAAASLVADILDIPKRDDSFIFRLGPVVRLVLSRRVELRGSFVVTVSSPDTIGLVGGDFTEFGVRYRWASE